MQAKNWRYTLIQKAFKKSTIQFSYLSTKITLSQAKSNTFHLTATNGICLYRLLSATISLRLCALHLYWFSKLLQISTSSSWEKSDTEPIYIRL